MLDVHGEKNRVQGSEGPRVRVSKNTGAKGKTRFIGFIKLFGFVWFADLLIEVIYIFFATDD